MGVLQTAMEDRVSEIGKSSCSKLVVWMAVGIIHSTEWANCNAVWWARFHICLWFMELSTTQSTW